MQKSRGQRAALFGALALFYAAPAQAVSVDVELQLLVDVSGSINATEFGQQLDAYANAFRSTAVQNAIFGNQAGNAGTAAVEMILWSDSTSLAIDWTLIDSAAAANSFADAIASLGRPNVGFLTDPAEAITVGSGRFAGNGFESNNQIVNLSTDGLQNTPNFFNPIANLSVLQTSVDNAVILGVDQINLLAIGSDAGGFLDITEQELLDYYSVGLTTGGNDPLLFSLTGFGGMESVLTQKLVTELNVLPVPVSAWMLLAGLGVFGWVGYRRQRTV